MTKYTKNSPFTIPYPPSISLISNISSFFSLRYFYQFTPIDLSDIDKMTYI